MVHWMNQETCKMDHKVCVCVCVVFSFAVAGCCFLSASVCLSWRESFFGASQVRNYSDLNDRTKNGWMGW